MKSPTVTGRGEGPRSGSLFSRCYRTPEDCERATSRGRGNKDQKRPRAVEGAAGRCVRRVVNRRIIDRSIDRYEISHRLQPGDLFESIFRRRGLGSRFGTIERCRRLGRGAPGPPPPPRPRHPPPALLMLRRAGDSDSSLGPLLSQFLILRAGNCPSLFPVDLRDSRKTLLPTLPPPTTLAEPTTGR